jgi:CheY-like chemotaxis protein
MNLSVTRAQTAADGIEMAKHDTFDLVLIDILLPDSTIEDVALTLIEPIRMAIGFKTPLVAVTAHAFKYDRDWLIANGCDHYISKPINFSEFQDYVTKTLQLET